MGGGTELVFVEGHSKDDTYKVIEKAILANPGLEGKATPANREWEREMPSG